MIKVEFNGNQFSIRQDVGVQELKQLFLKESDMRLERKDDEDGIWFEVVDIDDADLCEGAVFRAKKVSNNIGTVLYYVEYCALQVGCQAASCKVYVNCLHHTMVLNPSTGRYFPSKCLFGTCLKNF